MALSVRIVKKAVKRKCNRIGMRVSPEFYAALSEMVERNVNEAIARAKANGVKTLNREHVLSLFGS